jgi:hypothetical protein
MLHAEPLEGSIHTVRRPLLSDLAARAFFVGSQVPRVGPFMSANHQKVSVMNSLLRRYAGGDEVLPDEIFEISAREVCRFQRVRDCSAIIARWSVDHPNSDRWRATLSSARKAARSRSPSLSASRLEKLHALHSGRVIPGEDAAPAHVEARRATELFFNHYHHIVPFDRRVLEEVWGDCNGEECEAERAQFEEMLWGLDESDSQ